MSVSQRRDYVKRQNLCFNCLRIGHRAVSCSLSFSCHTCKRRHHSLPHDESMSVEPAEKSQNARMDPALAKEETSHGLMSACSIPSGKNVCPSFNRTIFKVVPVKVWLTDSSNAVSTHAFIDEGSSVNMCSESLV